MLASSRRSSCTAPALRQVFDSATADLNVIDVPLSVCWSLQEANTVAVLVCALYVCNVGIARHPNLCTSRQSSYSTPLQPCCLPEVTGSASSTKYLYPEQEQEKQLKEVERSVEALQEVEPLKRLEGSINRTMIWQHVRQSLWCFTMLCACCMLVFVPCTQL